MQRGASSAGRRGWRPDVHGRAAACARQEEERPSRGEVGRGGATHNGPRTVRRRRGPPAKARAPTRWDVSRAPRWDGGADGGAAHIPAWLNHNPNAPTPSRQAARAAVPRTRRPSQQQAARPERSAQSPLMRSRRLRRIQCRPEEAAALRPPVALARAQGRAAIPCHPAPLGTARRAQRGARRELALAKETAKAAAALEQATLAGFPEAQLAAPESVAAASLEAATGAVAAAVRASLDSPVATQVAEAQAAAARALVARPEEEARAVPQCRRRSRRQRSPCCRSWPSRSTCSHG